MSKRQDHKASEQSKDKVESIMTWEGQQDSDGTRQNVIPFPKRNEATYQELTITQDESPVQIRIVSSGFGISRSTASDNRMQMAA